MELLSGGLLTPWKRSRKSRDELAVVSERVKPAYTGQLIWLFGDGALDAQDFVGWSSVCRCLRNKEGSLMPNDPTSSVQSCRTGTAQKAIRRRASSGRNVAWRPKAGCRYAVSGASGREETARRRGCSCERGMSETWRLDFCVFAGLGTILPAKRGPKANNTVYGVVYSLLSRFFLSLEGRLVPRGDIRVVSAGARGQSRSRQVKCG